MIYSLKKYNLPLYWDANRCLSTIISIFPTSLNSFVRFNTETNQVIFSPNNFRQLGTHLVYLTIYENLGIFKNDSFYLTIYESPQIGKFKE